MSSILNSISLEYWINLCEKHYIPKIPIDLVGIISVESFFEAYDNKINEDLTILNDLVSRLPRQSFMLRWDCCSPLSLKSNLSKGDRLYKEEYARLYLDDPRAFDILLDCYNLGQKNIKLWMRPWVWIDSYNGWPIEYRVYVQDGKILGVSNYYPQRELRLEQYEIDDCIEYTQKLAKDIENFTADYIVHDGSVIFLEGGPPHLTNWGSDPCCFKPGEISGVCLKSRRE